LALGHVAVSRVNGIKIVLCTKTVRALKFRLCSGRSNLTGTR
jgi:hypothetical protein